MRDEGRLDAPMPILIGPPYFVCGMQLMFVATHLLAPCGMDPLLSAEALGMIGICDVFGGLFFGWAGGRGRTGSRRHRPLPNAFSYCSR